jgi:hypothetical protein
MLENFFDFFDFAVHKNGVTHLAAGAGLSPRLL